MGNPMASLAAQWTVQGGKEKPRDLKSTKHGLANLLKF